MRYAGTLQSPRAIFIIKWGGHQLTNDRIAGGDSDRVANQSWLTAVYANHLIFVILQTVARIPLLSRRIHCSPPELSPKWCDFASNREKGARIWREQGKRGAFRPGGVRYCYAHAPLPRSRPARFCPRRFPRRPQLPSLPQPGTARPMSSSTAIVRRARARQFRRLGRPALRRPPGMLSTRASSMLREEPRTTR